MKKNEKGILLTLATIVLLVLMVAELVTYVYLTISYETVSSFGTLANGGYEIVSVIKSGSASFLHSSLYSALNTLALYESQGAKKSQMINNTAYALESLMTNGTIYGANSIGNVVIMNGITLLNYTNSLVLLAKQEGFSLTITNATIQVYQSSPYSINATYSALATINSSSGAITSPIVSTSSILLNGSPDLYYVQNSNNYRIKIAGTYPGVSLIGNVVQPAVSAVLTGNTATYGSSGPFQFIYGTVIVDSGNSCPPSQFENTNYILAVQNDMTLGSCGLGGVVTSIQSSTAYSVPYLVYANSNVINYIGNGTTLLLDGPGLELLNISGLQRSIFSGYYYGSSFAPSYLAWAQNNASTKSPNGLYSFDLYNRQVPQFSTNAINSINVNQIFSVTSGRLNFSLSLWFAPKSQISSYSSSVLAKQVFFNLNITGSSIDFGSPCSTTISSVPINGIVFPNTWHNIVVTYNSTGVSTSNAYIYLDGVRVGSGSFSLCGSSSANFVIGGGQTPFSGSISNIQAYNSVLSSYQAARLYYEGIEGIAVPSKLVGWWPLNGNANDISGRGYNGNVIGTPTYQYLYGYSGDPIYDGSFYSGNLTNAVEGAYNCANINQCSNFSLQHLYLGQASLSSIIGGSKTEAASLGVGNALIPNVGSFNGNGYVSGNLIGYYDGGSGPYTFSAWAYVNSTTNGPVISLCAGNAFGSCTSTPVISISQSIIYANNGGSLSYSVTNPNSWHNIVVTYSSGTKNLYVDGISEGSVSGTLQVNGAGPVFWTTKTLSGKIADVQFFSNSLSAAQVSQLYLNDTVKGAAPTDRIPLSVGYNGLMNQSINSANALNPAFFANNNGACSNANVIDYICGAVYSQP